MHIVFLEFVQHLGGAPRSTLELASRLAKHVQVSIVDPNGCCCDYRKEVERLGLNYHVLCPNDKNGYIGGHANILSRTFNMILAWPEYRKIQKKAARLLREIGADIVCSNNPKSLYVVGGNRILNDIPLVGFLRGWYRPDMIPWFAKRIYNGRCDLLLTVSHATRSAVLCGGIDHNKVITLQNPVDREAVEKQSICPLKLPLPQKERGIKILLPAGLMKTKGQHTAIRAMRRILDYGYDAVLYLAGDLALGSDPHYIEYCKKEAEKLAVQDHVEWLGFRWDIPQIMNLSDVVILPTYTEGMPRSILESMALGKPVAATPVGGILDLIIDKLTGLFFNVEDDKGLAECIRYYCEYPQDTQRITSNAKGNIERNHSIDYHTKMLIHIFSGVIDKRNA